MKVPDSEWEYHEKEFAYDVDYKIEVQTGLWGVLVLLLTVFVSLATFIVASPFILFGVAELITKAPSQWRVRWIRKKDA